MDAVSDENTVLFDKDSLHDFEALRAKIRELKKGDVEETTGTQHTLDYRYTVLRR